MSIVNLTQAGDMELHPENVDGLLTSQMELDFVTQVLRPVVGTIFYDGNEDVFRILERIAQDAVRLLRVSEKLKEAKKVSGS